MLEATEIGFEFYSDVYGGDLSADSFARAIPAALRHVRWVTGNVDTNFLEDDELTALKRAVCAAADVFSEFGEGQIGGFQIGSFKMTHYEDEGTTGAEMATQVVMQELTGTNLIFTGAGR